MPQPLMTYGRFYTHPKKKFVRGVVRGIPIKGKNMGVKTGINQPYTCLLTCVRLIEILF